MALAGGVLLGLGMAGGHVGAWGGHTWQIATGGSMLGVGIIARGSLLIYMHKSRNEDHVMEALRKDTRSRIWTYAYRDGEEVMICKDSQGQIAKPYPGQVLSELKKSYSRVIAPIFS